MVRVDRELDELRPVNITMGVMKYAEGSALIEVGNTRLICTASVDDKVPQFAKGAGHGWITAEYAMLPRATPSRNPRDAVRGRASGRSYEIQRLIGRSLRSITDLGALGERTIVIDCDVIQADGGTRTTAVTGSYVALVQALYKLLDAKAIEVSPVNEFVAATSVGIVGSDYLLDLDFEEDSRARVDMNVVMTNSGRIVEIQATAEGRPFNQMDLSAMLRLAQKGISGLIAVQKEVLGKYAERLGIKA